MKNWTLIAVASDFGIPEADLERMAPVLDALEAAFRPLVREIPPETEPVTVFLPEEQP